MCASTTEDELYFNSYKFLSPAVIMYEFQKPMVKPRMQFIQPPCSLNEQQHGGPILNGGHNNGQTSFLIRNKEASTTFLGFYTSLYLF